MGGQLGGVFDFDVFPFEAWGRELLDGFQHHSVEFGSFQFPAAVFIDVQRGFQCFQQALLGECRGKNNLDVFERGDFFSQVLFVGRERFVVFFNENLFKNCLELIHLKGMAKCSDKIFCFKKYS